MPRRNTGLSALTKALKSRKKGPIVKLIDANKPKKKVVSKPNQIVSGGKRTTSKTLKGKAAQYKQRHEAAKRGKKGVVAARPKRAVKKKARTAKGRPKAYRPPFD